MRIRARITIRSFMIATVAVGIVLGFLVEVRRRSALYHDRYLNHFASVMRFYSMPAELLPRLEAYNDYHSEMAAKYERASRYPLLPVRPDTPEPPYPFPPSLEPPLDMMRRRAAENRHKAGGPRTAGPSAPAPGPPGTG